MVGITASGRTPYVIEALAVARQAGAATIAITNNAGSPATGAADHAVELLTGPEVLAGSTRLKAGTAQKVALDVLSTAAMIRCGRTYGPWMTGVQATNDKLRRRAARIVREITGADSATAAQALDAASGDTETPWSCCCSTWTKPRPAGGSPPRVAPGGGREPCVPRWPTGERPERCYAGPCSV